MHKHVETQTHTKNAEENILSKQERSPGGRKKLHNKELHKLHFSPPVITVIALRMI
jgi:hypothetical protein